LRSFRKCQTKHFNARGASAKAKTKVLMLAELPQMANQTFWCLRNFRKWQTKHFSACGASANGKPKVLMLAELPQASRKKN